MRLPTVAVIPARGGSKGVPGKNLRRVGGEPLVARAVHACRRAGVDAVYVSTDSPDIATAARAAGADVIDRPAALAGDLAGSESVLHHALTLLAERRQRVDVLVFVQCTSPFIRPADLAAGVDLVASGAADTAFSAVPTYEFVWRDRPGGAGGGDVVGQNHDASVRPRRQDRAPDYRETGAFYVMRADRFATVGHRFHGRVAAVAVPPLTALEIDTVDDLRLAEALAPLLAEPPAGLGVDAVITDFDGVHTDDRVSLDQHGTESVQVSRSDGLGVAMLRAAGVQFAIVSKERNPVVGARAAKLGVDVMQGIDDKVSAVSGWLDRRRIEPARTAYVGNDVNDLPVMALVGWPVAVRDAHPEVLRRARLVLATEGGRGAVRELCDLVLAERRSAPG